MSPILVDLFCKAGGCSEGYRRAGFDVIGVDIEPQPRYPFPFVAIPPAYTEFIGRQLMRALRTA